MMTEQGKRKNPKAFHEGMSYGICTKCGKEFKLKRKTKHQPQKRPKGTCPECGTRSQSK